MLPTPINYDRIAGVYDAGRGYPPEAAAQLGAAIVAHCGPAPLILELGVGAGRVAAPVRDAGGRVVGLDIGREMLGVARARGLDLLVQADVAHLPFAADRFDGAVAVQVLHHVPDWRGALAEATRALRPGGVLLYGSDRRDPATRAELLRRRMRETIIHLAPELRPPAAGAALGKALGALGLTPEPELIAATWVVIESPGAVLERLATRADLYTWVLPDQLLVRAVAEVRAWAERTWGDLDTPEAVEHQLALSAARKA
jgi:SAM-dependent methyltransferase